MIADACAIITFFLFGGTGMTQAGLAAMRGPVAVSPVTVWELTRKATLGKLPSLPVADSGFIGWLTLEKFTSLPLTWAAAERANALPLLHRDPMDRLLIAQAMLGELAIITNDRLFSAYGVPTIW